MKFKLSKISIRSQVIILGTVVVVLLVGLLTASFAALRYTRWAVLRDEQRHLTETTSALIREYADKDQLASQSSVEAPLSTPNSPASREILVLLSRLVLEGVPDASGGFYSTQGDTLVGLAPAASSSSFVLYDLNNPNNESNAVVAIARQAAITHAHAAEVIALDPDVILIDALPISGTQGYSCSAWTMKRLPVLPGANRLKAYLVLVALGAATLTCVILTFVIVRNLQRGVRKLENGLQGLEVNLSSQVDSANELGEIQRIAQAINRLGSTLSEKIESEKRIEGRLRHAERLAALGRLIAGVAHEVRNPLATIRLRVQLCQQLSTDPGVQESCAVALEEIERLNGMVGRLLNFSQPVQLHRETTDLRLLLSQRLRCFSEKSRENRVRIITRFPSTSALSDVDQSRMTQVFDNVIQNAIEAMADSGGTLCVSITPDVNLNGSGQIICVEFSDTGEGISSSQLREVFDPFFTTKPTGTGLGLSICHELVQAHSGEIHVVSAEGHGTTVRISLPAHITSLEPSVTHA